MNREDAVRKATAILRLAERAGTAGEKAAAVARAQAIMDKYSIEREALNLDGEPDMREPDEEIMDFAKRPDGELDKGGAVPVWKWSLAMALARANGCFLFQGRSRPRQQARGITKSIEIIGRPSKVETVRYMFAWLSKEIERLADEQGKGMGGVWRREFREGAANELGSRLKAERQRTFDEARANAAKANALVVINKAIAKIEAEHREVEAWATSKYSFGKARGYSSRQSDWSARAAGAAAAKGISLGRARGSMGPGAKKLIGGG